MNNIAFVFPGQGSQFVGMGEELYNKYQVARQVFEEVDDILQEKLSDMIFRGRSEYLNLTENTQPAIMTVSVAVARVFEYLSGMKLLDFPNVFMAGHSLGEYSAFTMSSSFSVADAAMLLKIRGTEMQCACPYGIGGMAAIIGATTKEVEDICCSVSQEKSICVVANDNCPGQLVISGHLDAVGRAIEMAKSQSYKVVKLNVSGPFHSPLIKDAATVLKDALEKYKPQKSKCGVICNVTAAPVYEPESISHNLVSQITSKVRWRESVYYLQEHGVRTVIEMGPGNILGGLIRKTSLDMTVHSLHLPNEIENFCKDFCTV